jgi:tetratricopeptide (TPR) repeat protein
VTDEPEVAAPPDSEPAGGPHVIDLVADELALARAQLDSGLPGLAEGSLRRRLARLEADGAAAPDESDALRVLLAEALWRQGRPAAARIALDAVAAGSPQRRLPIALLVEAEALAAAGERDRAVGAMERVVRAIGVDAAHELRGDVPGRLTWPLPAALAPAAPTLPARAPWAPPPTVRRAEEADLEVDDERVAGARVRVEEARQAYVAGDLERGDAGLSIAVRLDTALAADGVRILEPTLGGQPRPERLLLYGDLLRAAGREVEANEAYDRAAGQRS